MNIEYYENLIEKLSQENPVEAVEIAALLNRYQCAHRLLSMAKKYIKSEELLFHITTELNQLDKG